MKYKVVFILKNVNLYHQLGIKKKIGFFSYCMYLTGGSNLGFDVCSDVLLNCLSTFSFFFFFLIQLFFSLHISFALLNARTLTIVR